MSDEVRKYVFKVIVLGTEAVGKTSLIDRFSQKSFSMEYKPTLGTNIIIKELDHDIYSFKFMLWDIAGQSKWKGMRHLYYKGAQGALLVFDVTRPPTYQDIITWNDDLASFSGDIPKVLVANKIDLEKNVSEKEAKEMAKKIQAEDLIFTSAKTGEAVDKAFIKIALEIVSKEIR